LPKEKLQKTNNDRQNANQKTNDRATQNPLKPATSRIRTHNAGGYTDWLHRLKQTCSNNHNGPLYAYIFMIYIIETIDACDAVPCLNGGTCMDILGIVMCTCPPEYTGTTCEGKITSSKK
jgi:hypothetical protein